MGGMNNDLRDEIARAIMLAIGRLDPGAYVGDWYRNGVTTRIDANVDLRQVADVVLQIVNNHALTSDAQNSHREVSPYLWLAEMTIPGVGKIGGSDGA